MRLIVSAASEAWASFKRRVREEVLISQGVPRLDPSIADPPLSLTSRSDGVTAVGGDLGTDRLLMAYASGTFPCARAGSPLVWLAPDRRQVVDLSRARLPRHAIHALVRSRFDVTVDRAFEDVLGASALETDASFLNAMLRLHRMGHAHSVECWSGGRRVAGLHGIALGAAFFTVDLHSFVDGAAEVAAATLHERLREWGFSFVDYQTPERQPLQLGQEPWARTYFLVRVAEAVTLPARRGRWTIDGSSPLLEVRRAAAGARLETGA